MVGRETGVAWLALALVGLLAMGAGRARADGCANERATNVPVLITTSPDAKTCGLGIEILGFGGSLVGESCPRFETMTPAHGECFGAPLLAHECVAGKKLDVQFRDCDCGGLVIPFIETGFPVSCECSQWRSAGHVQDYETRLCSIQRRGRTSTD